MVYIRTLCDFYCKPGLL